MLQTLPEHRAADALVDARQALVRRVVAATPVDVRPARNRRRREQADHGRAVAVVRRRATWSPCRVFANFWCSEMISSIVRVPGDFPKL